MAQITVTNTSGRIETHMRGRVFRFHHARNREQHTPKVKEKRRICVLSARGGNELEHWGMEQPCFGPGCHHSHLTREHVAALVAEGIMKWVGIGKNVAAIAYGREWKGVGSGPERVKVMQLV